MNEKKWSLPLRYLALGFLLAGGVIGLWYIRSVLQPLIIAAFVAYLINPFVNLLMNHTRLSRKASVNLVFYITLILTVGTPSTLAPIFFDEFKQVFTDLLNIYNQLIDWMMQPLVISGISIDLSQAASQLAQFRSSFLGTLPEQALQLLESTSLGALWVIVVMVATYYFLSEWPGLRARLIGSFPDPYQDELNELYQRVRMVWMNYLRGQLLLMLIVGVVFTVAWTIIGIPGALVLGVIAGFLTLIPDVGPFLAAFLAVVVALLEGSIWIPWSNIFVALVVAGVYLLLIGLKNFWLRPYIMGRSVHMPEALVFISIIMSTMLWGILGALLIIPVLASMAIFFDYLRRRILGMVPFPDPDPERKIEPPATRLKSRTRREREQK
ncbi:MAG: AI-2E family transporter [Chloroflexi bacterium]|nr:AI-2E family transporter [Chloroflexota bacterium]